MAGNVNVSIVSAKSQIDEWQPRAERPLLPPKTGEARQAAGRRARRVLAERRRIKQIMVLDDRRSTEGSTRSKPVYAVQCTTKCSTCKMSCGLEKEEEEKKEIFGAAAVQFALMPRIKLAPASRTRQLPLLTLFLRATL